MTFSTRHKLRTGFHSSNGISCSSSFLLAKDSDFALPASDSEVIQSLIAYGAIFSRAEKEPKPTERLEILPGMLWLHNNHASPHTALARA